MEVNEFAHLTVEELNQQKLGHVHVATENLNSSTPLTRGRRTLGPQNFDWRTTRAGVVRPVQVCAFRIKLNQFKSIVLLESRLVRFVLGFWEVKLLKLFHIRMRS